jgi:hypothetical protein
MDYLIIIILARSFADLAGGLTFNCCTTLWLGESTELQTNPNAMYLLSQGLSFQDVFILLQ